MGSSLWYRGRRYEDLTEKPRRSGSHGYNSYRRGDSILSRFRSYRARAFRLVGHVSPVHSAMALIYHAVLAFRPRRMIPMPRSWGAGLMRKSSRYVGYHLFRSEL